MLGLLSNDSWRGGQSDWTAGAAELGQGNGDNAYLRAFSRQAAVVLARHFRERIDTWEVWNEPNAWEKDPETHYNPATGDLPGGTFLYPSNFAWLLKLSYQKIKAAQSGAVVISGGLFAHEPMGGTTTMMVNGTPQQVTKRGNYTSPDVPASGSNPGIGGSSNAATADSAGGSTKGSGATSPTTSGASTAATVNCTSTVPTGADSGASYLCSTYRMGRTYAGWTSGAYPMDQVGQHLYLDQGGPTSNSKITTYLKDLRNAYVAYEGSKTRKKTHITEVGWQQPSVSFDVQAQNLSTAYSTFRNTSYVGRAYWFSGQDVPEGGVYFGLVDSDGVHKPAFATYQSAAVY